MTPTKMRGRGYKNTIPSVSLSHPDQKRFFLNLDLFILLLLLYLYNFHFLKFSQNVQVETWYSGIQSKTQEIPM